MISKITYLVSVPSTTQRVVLEKTTIRGEPRIEIRKEWRRTENDDWRAAKAITIPMADVPQLNELLEKVATDTPEYVN